MKRVFVWILVFVIATSVIGCSVKQEQPSSTSASSRPVSEITDEKSTSSSSKTESESALETGDKAEEENKSSEEENTNPEKEETELVDGMRPEFKEALDSYEKFFNEYCEFMKKYAENPTDLNLLMEYTDFMTQYTETMDKMEALDDGEMNDAETKYYIEVTARISQKLLEVPTVTG